MTSEEQVFRMLKEDQIKIPLAVWGAVFYHMGGYVSYINRIAEHFVARNEPIPVDLGRQVLTQTLRVREVMQDIFYPKEAMYQTHNPVHYLVRELLMHHVANKAHVINMCVSYYINPVEEQPVPVEDARKVLVCTQSIRSLLDRLCAATAPDRPA